MTIWTPQPRSGDGPYYARLADAIEAAMVDGTLAPATKLPPQRHLAYDLGVTIGTVGRAYALLRERGLVSGEIGRGTYVMAQAAGGPAQASAPILPDFGGTRLHDAPADKLRFDSTAAPDIGQGVVIGETFASVAADHPLHIANYSRTHQQNWLDAGAEWLQRNDWRPAAEDVVPTHGAHAAALAVIAAVTAPGDRVAFETLTYSQLSRSARLIGRRIAPVETDDGGMVPEDFERVCAQQHPKVAFLIPTAHNPTLTIMDESRRLAIAQIARRHDVWLIEDDIYGGVSGDPTPLIASLAPERTFVVGGLSKAVAAGVRGGWVACPPHLSQRVKVTHKMTTGGLSFILTEAAARLVLSGAAKEISRQTVAEATAREAIARAVFAGHDFRSHPNVPFLWLKLPEAWLSGTFRNAALADGLLIDDEDEYKSARMDRSYHRVRIAFSSSQRETVKAGLERLRRLLDSGVAGYDAET